MQKSYSFFKCSIERILECKYIRYWKSKHECIMDMFLFNTNLKNQFYVFIKRSVKVESYFVFVFYMYIERNKSFEKNEVIMIVSTIPSGTSIEWFHSAYVNTVKKRKRGEKNVLLANTVCGLVLLLIIDQDDMVNIWPMIIHADLHYS
jgi:hypothetical protein